MKQALTTIFLHEAIQECVWQRSMIKHIQEKYGLSLIKDAPTVLYKDNVAHITRIEVGYIKDLSSDNSV